jgi:hypothetical protein
MDGTNRLEFHFIDLYDAVVRSIQDPTLKKKLYHAFEMQLDKDGLRVFISHRKQELCHPDVQSNVL